MYMLRELTTKFLFLLLSWKRAGRREKGIGQRIFWAGQSYGLSCIATCRAIDWRNIHGFHAESSASFSNRNRLCL